MIARTCRWCGRRDANPGRLCATCDTTVPDPPACIVSLTATTLDRQYRIAAIERLGPITAQALGDELLIDGREARLRLTQDLWRLAKDGILEVDRTVRPFTYRRRAA